MSKSNKFNFTILFLFINNKELMNYLHYRKQSNIKEDSLEQTPFAIAINEAMSCRQDPTFESSDEVGKYRLYYKLDKPFATWKKNKPLWI